MRRLFANRRILRALMAAFVPYVAAAMVLDAIHIHPGTVSEHGPNCRHHVTAATTAPAKSTNNPCPACTWQRNQSQQASPVVAARGAASVVIVPATATIDRPADRAVSPALFRGPPALHA